jgi:hypothetical protein
MCHIRKRVTTDRRDDSWPARRDENGPDLRTGAHVPGPARVGDGDREEVINLLVDAFADGRLTRDEFDARSTEALAARTGDDLKPLTEDLAPGWLADHGRVRRDAPHPVRAAAPLRADKRSYVGIMLLLITVWLVTGLVTQSWYPWFVWPALGWGIGIVARTRRTTHRSASSA